MAAIAQKSEVAPDKPMILRLAFYGGPKFVKDLDAVRISGRDAALVQCEQIQFFRAAGQMAGIVAEDGVFSASVRERGGGAAVRSPSSWGTEDGPCRSRNDRCRLTFGT
jgi:hypothetical protein